MALFGKPKKGKDDKKKPEIMDEVKVAAPTSEVGVPTESVGKEISGNWSAGGNQVLRGFYISEKASFLNGMNQYVFKVFKSANKPEVKNQVEKIFNVKVKEVKILNMPRKRRDMGRHPGFKTGFKKAIVVLEEGQSIDQAKT